MLLPSVVCITKLDIGLDIRCRIILCFCVSITYSCNMICEMYSSCRSIPNFSLFSSFQFHPKISLPFFLFLITDKSLGSFIKMWMSKIPLIDIPEKEPKSFLKCDLLYHLSIISWIRKPSSNVWTVTILFVGTLCWAEQWSSGDNEISGYCNSIETPAQLRWRHWTLKYQITSNENYLGIWSEP